MKKVILIAALAILCAVGGHAMAKNSGESAHTCVSNDRMGNIVNNCGEQVFIIWCGNLQYSNKACGDGPNGSYFTHSNNLKPGASETIKVKPGGQYFLGSCFGGISFGNSGEYEDSPNGSYTCLPK
jgi:hypothetical protein